MNREPSEGGAPGASTRLRQYAQMLEEILSTTVDQIYLVDRDGRYLFANLAGSQALGLKPGDIVGKTWRELGMAAEAMERIDRERAAVFATGQPVTSEMSVPTAHGTRYYECTISPVHGPDGGVEAVVMTIHDITERKREEQERLTLLVQERSASEAAKRATDRAIRLQRVTAALSAALMPQRVAETVVTAGVAALKGRAGAIVLLTDDGTELQLANSVGFPPSLVEAWQCIPVTADSPSAEAVRTREPIWIESHEVLARQYPGLASQKQLTDLKSWAAVPLILDDKILGALVLSFAEPHSFDPGERAFILTLAHQCSQALDRARLYEAERIARAEAEHERDFVRRVLDNAPIAIGVLGGPEHQWTLLNPTSATLLGLPAERILGRTTAEILPRDYRPGESVLDRVYQSGEVQRLHGLRLHTPDGRTIYVDLTYAPLPGSNGKPSGVIYLANDVTPRILAEQERDRLLAQETKAREDAERARQRVTDILESITDAFLALDREGRFTYVNKRATEIIERLLGREPGDLIGKNVWDVIPKEIGAEFSREYRRAVTRKIPVIFESFYAPLEIWFEVNVYPSSEGLSIYFRDITQRKHAEEERNRLLSHERAIAEIAQALVREVELGRVVDVVVTQSVHVLGIDDVAVWLADPERQELTLLAAHGFKPDFFEIKHELSFSGPYLASKTARTEKVQVIEDVQAPSVPPRSREFYVHEGLRSLLAIPLRARGQLIGVLGYGTRTPRHFTPGDLGFFGTIADLFAVAIENAHLYDRVRQTLRLREEFMAASAHELRTPVTVIKGRVEWLLRTDARDPHVRHDLDSILRHSERITHLIDDLLAVVRVRPGLISLHCERVDLSALTRDLVSQIAKTTERHQFQIESDGPLVVDADRQLIGEVLNRLLENALRYSPEGGLIQITANRKDRSAIVSVTDHGVGISPERQPHVFEPFYELVPPGVPGYVGLVSLGLYLSRQIIDAHNGHIWFTSAPGKGSTFSFSLPLAASNPSVAKVVGT